MLQNSTGDKLSQFTNISVHSHKEQNIIKLPRGNETPQKGTPRVTLNIDPAEMS